VYHNGFVQLLKYKSATGSVSFEFVNNGGSGTTLLGSATWTKSWTSFSPFSVNGTGHVLIYKMGTGDAKVVRLNAGGTGTDTIWSSLWTLGWS
jgi:hypothetical protein